MPPSYLLLRNETYHLRLRVPSSLTAVIGCTELRLSLFEQSRRTATLKAGFLAYQIRQFFSQLRRLMKHLPRPEIERLVSNWKAKMVDRDGEVRRLIETGLGNVSLAAFGIECDLMGDQCRDLAEAILPSSITDEHSGQLKGPPLARARERATDLATAPNDPADVNSDWVPLIDRVSFDMLDSVSGRDLIQTWLPEAARMFYAKSTACDDAGLTVEHLRPQSSHAPSLTTDTSSLEDTTKAFAEALPAPARALRTSAPGLSLGDAWNRYTKAQSERQAAWKTAVPDSARLAFEDFGDLIGSTRELKSIGREDLSAYEAFANKRPRRGAAAYRNMTVAELASTSIAPEAMQSKNRVAESVDRIKSFFRWCTDEHLIERSPAQGLGAFLPEIGEPPRREAWTKQEIRTLLHPDNLRAFLDSRNRKGRKSTPQRYTYFPWLLVLATYTGARLNELGGLLVSDFEPVHEASEGETPVILIKENQLRTLKTAQASRAIPMHPHLEALGLWELMRHRRNDVGATQALWTPPRGDDPAGKVTDDFKAYTEMLGLYVKNVKVFHSFRHTFKTSCRGLPDDGALNSIVGHATSDATGGVYEHALQIPRHRHREALSGLDFGIDLPALSALLRECRSTADTGRSYAPRRSSAA
jgi:integrase